MVGDGRVVRRHVDQILARSEEVAGTLEAHETHNNFPPSSASTGSSQPQDPVVQPQPCESNFGFTCEVGNLDDIFLPVNGTPASKLTTPLR
ncbi:hypothetical protein GJAV_G00094090 [Gymnothorax javanicus]|nr:hypothetical protein GJAV_G00094090 [Gymnothorax javanicus]